MDIITFVILTTGTLLVLAIIPQTRPIVRGLYKIVVLVPKVAVLVVAVTVAYFVLTNLPALMSLKDGIMGLAQLVGK